MINLLSTQLGRFKVLAFGEGISFLALLFITMPLKYALDVPGPNRIIGLIHGLLFVLYVFAVIQIKIEKAWKNQTMLQALLAAIIPFGTFYITARILPKEEQED